MAQQQPTRTITPHQPPLLCTPINPMCNGLQQIPCAVHLNKPNVQFIPTKFSAVHSNKLPCRSPQPTPLQFMPANPSVLHPNQPHVQCTSTSASAVHLNKVMIYFFLRLVILVVVLWCSAAQQASLCIRPPQANGTVAPFTARLYALSG